MQQRNRRTDIQQDSPTVEHLHLALAVVHTTIGGTNRFEGEEAHVLAVLGRLAVLVGCLDNLLTVDSRKNKFEKDTCL